MKIQGIIQGKFGGRTVLYFILFMFVFVFAFPFYYMFVLSSWPRENMFTNPPHLFFGNGIIENTKALFNQLPFGINYFNSVMIAGLSTTTTIFFCTMCGFAFAKYNFKGKNLLFIFILATLAIPQFLNIIPFFKMMVFFGWYNTWLPLIVPGMANAFGIFLMSQFLQGAIPEDLLNAGRIDGLSEFGLLIKIVFPLAKAGISVLGIVTFIGSWNNFLGALILLPKLERTTIPVALSSLFVRSDGNFGGLFVGISLSLLPLIIVFLLFSRRIIADITAGSISG
jgi:multiple sugar transport system permease protein